MRDAEDYTRHDLRHPMEEVRAPPREHHHRGLALHVDLAGIVEEHVVRLEVAMQHAVLVQVRHLAQGEGDGGVLGGEW